MRSIKIAFITLLFAVFVNAQDMGKVDEAVQKQVGEALTAYYAVTDAMIESDGDKASAKSEELIAKFAAVDAARMTAAQKAMWGKLSVSMRSDAEHIVENTDIEHQRAHFKKLSNSLYSLIVSFKANESEAYLQYCPMKKASWLSIKKEIRNPYYGNKMLDCGSVKATLKKNK